LQENPHIADEIELQIRAQLLGGDLAEEAANSEEIPANDDVVVLTGTKKKS
jgi:hypothetical protein